MEQPQPAPSTNTGFTLHLEFDEERIAQLLTRDAWSYFSSPTELKNRFPVREIPPMPHNGEFHMPSDPTIVNYYLNFATSYYSELKELGWPPAMYREACDRLLRKIESATGLRRRSPVPDLRERRV